LLAQTEGSTSLRDMINLLEMVMKHCLQKEVKKGRERKKRSKEDRARRHLQVRVIARTKKKVGRGAKVCRRATQAEQRRRSRRACGPKPLEPNRLQKGSLEKRKRSERSETKISLHHMALLEGTGLDRLRGLRRYTEEGLKCGSRLRQNKTRRKD